MLYYLNNKFNIELNSVAAFAFCVLFFSQQPNSESEKRYKTFTFYLLLYFYLSFFSRCKEQNEEFNCILDHHEYRVVMYDACLK